MEALKQAVSSEVLKMSEHRRQQFNTMHRVKDETESGPVASQGFHFFVKTLLMSFTRMERVEAVVMRVGDEVMKRPRQKLRWERLGWWARAGVWSREGYQGSSFIF